MLDDAEDVLPRRPEPGADGRAAEVHHAQSLLALVDSPAIAGNRLGVRGHLAAEGHQHGVLQLGAADLDHAGELLLFRLKRLEQGDHLAFQVAQVQMAATRKAVG